MSTYNLAVITTTSFLSFSKVINAYRSSTGKLVVDLLFMPGNPTATKLASSFAKELPLSDANMQSRRAINETLSNATVTITAVPQEPSFFWLVNASASNSETIVDAGEGAEGAAAAAATTSSSTAGTSQNGTCSVGKSEKGRISDKGPSFLLQNF